MFFSYGHAPIVGEGLSSFGLTGGSVMEFAILPQRPSHFIIFNDKQGVMGNCVHIVAEIKC